MSNFNFNASVDTCNITGLKDKTVSSIIIPDYVTSIGDSVFCDCDKLRVITYRGTKGQWNAIHKNERWKKRSTIKTIHCTDGDIKI